MRRGYGVRDNEEGRGVREVGGVMEVRCEKHLSA